MHKGIFSIVVLLSSLGLIGQERNQVDAQGRKQGAWEKYFEGSKAVFYQGQFKDDKPQGLFTYFYRDGSIKGHMDYRRTGVVSSKTYYPKKGLLMAQGNYIDQKKDSVWNYYTRSGELSSTEVWDKGAKHGEERVFFEDGGLAELTTHVDGLRNGPWKQFHENGNVKVSGAFVRDQLEGPIEYHFQSGAMEIKGKFIDGSREGTWMYFNKDGSVRYQAVYRAGELIKERKENGTFEERGPDDILLSVISYKNGLREGGFQEYYEEHSYEFVEDIDPRSGERYTKQVLVGNELKREGNYQADVLHGEVKIYNEKGILMERQHYIKGEKQ